MGKQKLIAMEGKKNAVKWIDIVKGMLKEEQNLELSVEEVKDEKGGTA